MMRGVLFIIAISLWLSSGTASEVPLREAARSDELSATKKYQWPEDWDEMPCSSYTKRPSDLPNTTSTDEFRCTYFQNVTSCADASDGGYINYVLLPYCRWPSVKPLAYIVLFIWLTFLFISLGSTAEDFFCPALTTISQSLHLSQNIAGVTFLAFGNGAPDIFSAYAAIHASKDGNAGLAIGALFGAGVFVTTVVVGSVSFARPFALTQRPFLRDVIFYLGAVFWAFVVLWNHKMTIAQAAGFVGLYVFYVLVVVIGRYIYQSRKKRVTGRGDIPSPIHKAEGDELEPPSPNGPRRPSGLAGMLPGMGLAPGPNLTPGLSYGTVSGGHSVNQAPGLSVQHLRITDEGRDRANTFHGQTEYVRASSNNERTPLLSVDSPDDDDEADFGDAMRRLRQRKPPGAHLGVRTSTTLVAGALNVGGSVTAALVHSSHVFEENSRRRTASADAVLAQSTEFANASVQFEGEPCCSCSVGNRCYILWDLLTSLSPIELEAFKQESKLWKALDIFKIPIQFCLLLTTPVVALDQEDQNWKRPLNSLHCITAPLFVCLVVSGVSPTIGGVFPVYGAVALGGLALAILVFFTSRNDQPPRYHPAFAFLGFLVSVVWIYAIANEIVSLLLAFGLLFQLSDAILGLTLLAWGNSIGDLVSNVTMAKQGFPRMAIAACFGGPLLNILLGIGIACTVKSIQGKGSFYVNFTFLQKICGGYLMGSLCLSLITMMLMRFNAGRKYGVLLLIFYLLFLVNAITIETGILGN